MGEEIVGKADRKLSFIAQLLNDGVIFRIILKPAAGIDRAGDAETVELAHEVPRRVDLVLERQLRPLGERRIEYVCVGFGQQETGRIAIGVARDLAARRLLSVLRVADGAQCGAVQQRPVVQVQDEHRSVGRDGVKLVDRRKTLFGELMFGESADHAHPLGRRRDRDLALQHIHRVGERPHAVPAELHIEVEAAPDDVEMVVDQARQGTPALEVDDLRRRAGELHHLLVVTDGGEDAFLYCHRAGGRIAAIERGEKAAVQDEIGRAHVRFSFAASGVRARASACRPGSRGPGARQRLGRCPTSTACRPE